MNETGKPPLTITSKDIGKKFWRGNGTVLTLREFNASAPSMECCVFEGVTGVEWTTAPNGRWLYAANKSNDIIERIDEEPVCAAVPASDEAIDLLCDCAGQFLMTQGDGTIRHSFMATEERLCDFLVRVGLLEEIGRGHFRWTSAAIEPNAPDTGEETP